MLTTPSMPQLDNAKPLAEPNLPSAAVIAVAVGIGAGEAIINKLQALGIGVITVPPHPMLPQPVSSHADLQLLHVGGKQIFKYAKSENKEYEHLFSGDWTSKFEISEISKKIGNTYPNDVRLNCAVIADKIICNVKTVAREILEYAYKSELTVINVNQGYSNCSVCVVSPNAFITDDKSIFQAAGNFFNDAQLISKGSIGLNGYNYGFIGGCCGMIDKNKLAFSGKLESHSDYKIIADFMQRNSIECIELTENKLTDIGGILPLYEQCS